MKSIREQALERLKKVDDPTPQQSVHDALAEDSDKRNAPMQGPGPDVVESMIAGTMKNNPVVNFLRQSTEPDVYYSPTNEDLTQYPELLEGIAPKDHAKVLGSLSLMEARKVANDIRERDRLTAIQFSNGTVTGMASELASWMDPVTTAVGGSAIKGLAYIPKALRANKLRRTAVSAATLGGVANVEERLSQLGREESRDEDDVLYATAAGMAAGAVFAPFMIKGGKVSDVDAVAKHADTRYKAVGKEIQNDLDEAMVKNPERDTRGFTQPDEAYDISGRDIEVTPESKDAMKQSTATQNFTDEEVQLAMQAEALDKTGGLIKIPEKIITKLLKKNPFLTDGFRALTSKSKVANMVGSHLGEAAVGQRGTIATTAAMHKAIKEADYLAGMIPRMENAQAKYLSKRGIKKWNILKYNGSGKTAFDEDLMRELGRRYSKKPVNPNVDEFVKEAADAIDEVTRRAIDDLKAAKWAGADAVQWKPGYFPLVWSGEKIQKLASAGRLQDVKKLLTKSYTSTGMSPALSKRLTDAVVNRQLAGASDLDFNPASLFSKSSRGELERMLRETEGISELDIKGIMKLTDSEAGGALKTRTDIDINGELDDLRVVDLLQTDMGNLMSRWAQRSAGMVGLGKKGVRSFDEIDSIKKVSRSQAKGAGEDAEKLGKSVDAIFDQLLARPVNGGVDRNMRRFLDWSMVTKLGQIGFAQIAELNNITAAHGVFQTLKSIPAARSMQKQLRTALRTGDFSGVDKQWFSELQVLGGSMMDEHLLYRPSVRLDETVATGWGGVFDNVMAQASDKLGYMSGMYKVKGIEQAIAIMLQTDKVVQAARRLKVAASGIKPGKDFGRLQELGWGDETILRLKTAVDQHATFNGKVLDRLNLEQWDATTRTEFLSGLHRHVNQVIQRPMAGEGTYWMHSNTGAMFTQFRSFPLLAMEKQTGRHMLAGDAEMGLAMMYGMGWATVASMAKTYANALGRSDKKEYIEKRMEPGAMALQAMNYNSTFSILGDTLAVGGGLLGMPIAGGSRGSTLIPPALSGATRLYSGVADVSSGLNPLTDNTLTERGVRNTISAVPLSNTVPMAWVSNGIARLVDDE